MARSSYLAPMALAGLMAFFGNTVAVEKSSDGCVLCHSDPEFFVKDKKLHDYYQGWLKSPHAAVGMSCSDCHGGDPSATRFDIAHAKVRHFNDIDSPLYYKNQPVTCGACHADKAEQFRQSKHYKALVADTLAPTCTTCHRGMNRRPDFRDIVTDACENCHNEDNPDRVLVANQVREYLQRLNIAKGYLGWTQFYYESHGWPGDSRAEVAAITRKYEEAVTRVHRFDLATMDESSNEILAQLAEMFQKAWQERKGLEEPDES